MSHQPALLIITHNRLQSLKRLVQSLEQASFKNKSIDLIISADLPSKEITEYLSGLPWLNGNKRIITRDPKLGLKKHILSAISESLSEYDSVIVLEDDVIVSNYFYEFAQQAEEFYRDDPNTAGISLYSYGITENTFESFIPLDNGQDTFFMQVASSWGEMFTASKWKDFISWLDGSHDLLSLPDYARKWSEHSWKKLFLGYLIAQNKYIVYPYISLSTNFADKGQNIPTSLDLYQRPLLFNQKEFSFSAFDAKSIIYDSHFELLPSCFRSVDGFTDKDFIVDLRGSKHPEDIKADYWLTIKDSVDPIKSYGIHMIPRELNIFFNIEGSGISLTSQKSLTDKKHGHKLETMNMVFKLYHGLGRKGKVLPEFFKTKLHFVLRAFKRLFSQ